jgi:hypothetical protein
MAQVGPLRDVTLSSALDPSAVSSGRAIHLGRSLSSVCRFEDLILVHSFQVRRYPVQVVYHTVASQAVLLDISVFCSVSYPPIHLIRIRIQHLRLNTDPDPDPIRIQGLITKNRKKVTDEIFFFFF